jgi:hypothetical protein
MKDSRSFEAVTRELRRQEAVGEKVIASIKAFRPAGKAKITLANASIMLGNAESVMREVSTLRDELRLNAFAVEARYVQRNAIDLDTLYDNLLAAANDLVEKASPIAPLGACTDVIDTVTAALVNGGQNWAARTSAFSESPTTSFIIATYTRQPYTDGDNKLVVIVSVEYPDTGYAPTSARYALSVLYGPLEAYVWEANVVHRSFSVNLGAASSTIGTRAADIIASRLERDDVTLRFNRRFKQPRRANEIRADDICGMSILPLAITDMDEERCLLTVGVDLPGLISPTSLVALGSEIKRRTINQLGIRDINVTDEATLVIGFVPETDMSLAAERIKKLAQR